MTIRLPFLRQVRRIREGLPLNLAGTPSDGGPKMPIDVEEVVRDHRVGSGLVHEGDPRVQRDRVLHGAEHGYVISPVAYVHALGPRDGHPGAIFLESESLVGQRFNLTADDPISDSNVRGDVAVEPKPVDQIRAPEVR